MLSNPSILDVAAVIALVLGLVGQVSLFAFPRDRRVLERGLAVLFTLMVGGAVGLAWRAEQLRDADRDLVGPQFAGLVRALASHPADSYEFQYLQGDREAQALARRIAEAVKAATGRAPAEAQPVSTGLMGVLLAVRDRSAGVGLAVEPIGLALMAARIAAISENAGDLPPGTMRILVGRKP